MTKQYWIKQTCTSCEREEELLVSKRDAAFHLVNYNQIFPETCIECHSKNFITSLQIPDLDFELLEEWGTN